MRLAMPTKNRSKLSKRSGSRYTSAHGRLILERLDDRILPSGFRSFDFTPPAPINPGDHNIHTQSFQTIDNPDGDYLNSTTKIEIDPTLDDYTAIDSVSDGSLTVTFAAGGEVRTVPTSWLSWSSPPFSENSSPRLVFTQPGSLLFDSPVTTFGVEIEPNEIAIHTVVVHFQDADGSDIGTISRDVRGDRGARLFALRVDPSNG